MGSVSEGQERRAVRAGGLRQVRGPHSSHCPFAACSRSGPGVRPGVDNPSIEEDRRRDASQVLRVGILKLLKDRVLEAVKRNAFVKAKVAKTQILFIDELPLIQRRWFLDLDYVVRQLAQAGKHNLPWGGCEVVGKLVCERTRRWGVSKGV